MRSSLAVCAGLAVSLWAANAAMAAGPEVIVSSIQSSPTSLIPGDPNGERFQSDFNNLYRSPNGTRWIVTNETGSGQASKSIVTGSGTSFTVPAFMPIGGLAPWVDINSPQVFNTFGVVYAINDAGQWAMGVRESVNARIVKFDNGVWSFPAIEGDAIPGVPGKVWGTSFDVYSLNSDGSVLNFRGSDTGVVEDYFFRGNTLTVQTPVTIPTGQVGTTNLAWQNFGDSGYGMADGNGNWFVVGDLTGTSNDDIAVLNGAVVAQQGAPFGSLGAIANSRISVPYLTGNGAHWYLRGTSGTTHWIAKDGAAIAQTGGPIITGSTDLYANITGYSRTFASVVGDNAGNYVIIGGANDGVTSRGVAVYNSTKILLSDGDPIDLDGNGEFDDDVFVLGLAAVDFYTNFLGEDGYWYAVVSTRLGSGSPLGEALVRVRVTPACTADINGTGGVTADDIFAFLDAWFVQNGQTGSGLTADFNSSGSVTADDIFAFLDAWFVQNGVCQ